MRDPSNQPTATAAFKPAIRLLVLSLSLTLFAPQTALNAADRPNIIVILCDDLGYGDLECYGHPHIKTPNLNKLADSGIRLTNCYSAAPVCSPSRVGLLTGRSPNRAGVYDWIPPGGATPRKDAREQVHMRKNEVTIAHLLRSAGYATCMSGKWHCNSRFNSSAQPQPGDAGFDHWFGTQNNASPSHENPDNYVRNGSKVGELEGFSCQLAANEAMGWVENHHAKSPEQPFFVYLAFHEPHEPVASPPALVSEYSEVAEDEDEAQYFANVANVDRAVGNVIGSLERLELRDDTLVFFSSDNGPETLKRYSRANRSWGRATPLRGMKLWTTDAGFRVAGMLSWPGSIKSGQVSDTVFSSLDLLPTFCAIAQIPSAERVPAERLDGIDASSFLAGSKLERTKPLLWCYYNAINERRVAMRWGKWKMLARLDGNQPKLSNVHDGNRKQVFGRDLSNFQLYDVAEDISESNDLFATAAEAESLRIQMEQSYAALLADSHVWTRAQPAE